MERTLVLVKPDGVRRALVGTVISRFEQRSLKVVALKMTKPALEHIDSHYPKDEAWVKRLGQKGFKSFAELGMDPKEAMGTEDEHEAGQMVREWLMSYMTEAPIIAMVVEGIHAVEMVRKIVGNTLPSKADIGTIRGDFSVDSSAAANVAKRAIKNLVHASETIDEAKHEITHWFSEEEIYEYQRADESAMY